MKDFWLFLFCPDFFNASDFEEHWEEFLLRLRDLNVGGIRIFEQFSWTRDNILSPYPQIGYWDAGYSDGELLPFYDQGDETPRWNQVWVEKNEMLADFLRHKWSECRIVLTLHDYCSIKGEGQRKYLYPFLSSAPDKCITNPEYDRYPGGFWGMGADSVQFLHKRYAEKVMSFYEGLPYYIEFCNEDGLMDWPDDYVKRYYKWLCSIIPPSRLIISGRWAAIQPGVYYSQHGIIKPVSDINLPPLPKNLIIPSGDGASGGSGPADEAGQSGLGLKELAALVEWIKECGFPAYEYMDNGLWSFRYDKMCLDDFDWDLLKIIMTEFGLYKEPEPPRPKVKVTVCMKTGHLATTCCEETEQREYEVGCQPLGYCYLHYPVQLDICLDSQKVAGRWCKRVKRVSCSQEIVNYDICDTCKSCSYWWKRRNFKKWIKCLLGI